MSELALSRRGAAAILTIRREHRQNSISRGLLQEFAQQQHLLDDESVRLIVVTAAGDRVFCAGADLKERRQMSDHQVREQLLAYRSELGWLDTSPKPTLAALNGVALGGGLELALLCDLRVARPHVVLGLPETGLGIIPGAGGTQRLPRLVGESRAKELILLQRRLTAREAWDIGLLHYVCPEDEEVLDAALRWAEPILNGAPLAQAAALQAIDAAGELPLPEGLELERQLYDRCLSSDDRREALEAFDQKRLPTFRGR